jgi:hypothetical protein
MHGRRTQLPLLAAAMVALSAASAARAETPPQAVPAQAVRAASTAHEGIWKAAVPAKGSMRGEFDSNDPVGVAAGERIAADCSINWVDPDERKLYCFSSATSLVFFLDAPHAWLERARREWTHLAPAG